MDRIEVSREMTALVGSGGVKDLPGPRAPVCFLLQIGALGSPATLRYLAHPTLSAINADPGSRIILLVDRSACDRVAGGDVAMQDGAAYFLPAALRAIALAIRDYDRPEGAAAPYRLAKSIELLCEILRADRDDGFVPIGHDAVLSRADSERLLSARQMIEERWAEKLTLNMIARSCGLNRAKLTRGFRDMFDCSVADAIVDERLGKAAEMLLGTDLPISSIGYRCGYLSNTSFTRAFTRRFGRAPTHYRMDRLVA